MNQLGTWIRDSLNDLGRNQAWLAEKIGVQPPQVSRIISGSSEPTPELLGAIADALGKPRVQAYRAAGYLNQEPEPDEWVEEMAFKINRVPSGLRGIVTNFINSLLSDENQKSNTNQRKRRTRHKPPTP
ncbi:MAG: helix-turn-helix domain-containing protein [Anaerolineales bacterium]